ncbi:hypothetical protein H0X10_03200 [Candidatus Saccharibacteria bacterium]|nr:hypothetical protein [Candidatus Saccharibacteria bacterium]
MKKLRKFLAIGSVQLALVALVALGMGFAVVQATRGSNKPVVNTNCDGICVALSANGMNPNELAVKVGEFVQFNSADGKMHNISDGKGLNGGDEKNHESPAASSDDDHNPHDVPHDHVGSYASGDFAADEAWRVQFKKPGTYRLHDHYNPKLEIVVVVYEPGASSRIE